MESKTTEISNTIKESLIKKGASIVGFASLHEIADQLHYSMPFAILIAVALNPQIISKIAEGPTLEYCREYKNINDLLTELSTYAANLIKDSGHNAIPKAATNSEIDDLQSTPLPHKTIATRAGIGWIGKCALLVTPAYGSAIRITSVFTDLKLAAGKAINYSKCDECTVCVDKCPAHAISGRNWEVNLKREDFYDYSKCRKIAQNYARNLKYEDSICGICISVCPWTKKYLNRTDR